MKDDARLDFRKISPDDYNEVADTMACAFMDDPLLNLVAPRDRDRMEILRIMEREMLRYAGPQGHCHAAFEESGRAVGAVVVTVPGRYPPSRWREFKIAMRVLLHPRPWIPPLRDLRKIVPYTKAMDEHHIEEPHWFIWGLGVRRSHHGCGIGGRLLRIVLEHADHERSPVYLDTQTKSNVGLYERFGFSVDSIVHPSKEGPPSWGMVRRAD